MPTDALIEIIHVDDEVEERNRIANAFRIEGAKVRSLTSLKELSDFAEEQREAGTTDRPNRLFLLDVKFRGRTMIDRMARLIRTTFRTAAMIILTNHGGDPEVSATRVKYNLPVMEKGTLTGKPERLREEIRRVYDESVQGRRLASTEDHSTQQQAESRKVQYSMAGHVVELRPEHVVIEAWDEADPEHQERRLLIPRAMFIDDDQAEEGSAVRYQVYYSAEKRLVAEVALAKGPIYTPPPLSSDEQELLRLNREYDQRPRRSSPGAQDESQPEAQA